MLGPLKSCLWTAGTEIELRKKAHVYNFVGLLQFLSYNYFCVGLCSFTPVSAWPLNEVNKPVR